MSYITHLIILNGSTYSILNKYVTVFLIQLVPTTNGLLLVHAHASFRIDSSLLQSVGAVSNSKDWLSSPSRARLEDYSPLLCNWATADSSEHPVDYSIVIPRIHPVAPRSASVLVVRMPLFICTYPLCVPVGEGPHVTGDWPSSST